MVPCGFGAVYLGSEHVLHDHDVERGFSVPIPVDENAIRHGEHVARTRGCLGCHGEQLEGIDFGEQWDWPERAVAPNLARYAREHDAATIEAAVRRGFNPSGRELTSMPSYNFTNLSDEDMAALIAFLRAAPVVEKKLPKPDLGWKVRLDFALGRELSMADWVDRIPKRTFAAGDQSPLAQGEYLAKTMCIECHGLDLRGESFYNMPPTPDLAIVAAYNREQFEGLIESGFSPDGRPLGLMTLVAPDRFVHLSDEEVDNLYAYLRSLGNTPHPDAFWRPQGAR